ncbi:ABC transporter permease [Paenibacillus thiaminolyticus]|uniref:ABC transporter permease n=1 Tax=Paenibacillus thiaminolyticus TaxID=49283 RepID=A0A3A3GKG5_PANTH|nr:ABC transporter permease [Paenibacillus thiaminolyticus]RJG25464.1 ABC transporter permease [Paenibacillus thiaminolyticus]
MKSWYIAKKDLLIQLKDIPGLIYLFITPIIVIAVASFALSNVFDSKTEKFKIPIVVQDQGELAEKVVTELKKIPALDIQETYKADGTDKPYTEEEAKKEVQTKKAAIIIPQDFTKNAYSGVETKIVIIEDKVDRIIPSIVFNAVTQIIADIEKGITQQQAAAATPRNLKVESKELTDEGEHKPTPFESNVPGYAVMFVLLGTASAAGAFVEERENGTLRKILTLPVNSLSIILGKMLSCFITAIVQCAVLFSVGHFVFGMWLGKSIPALALLIVCTAFASSSLAILLASICKSRSQANGISILIVLSMSALGGSWWPLYIEPEWMQKLAHITITAWAMGGFNDLLIYNKGFSAVLGSAAALIGMGILFLSISIRKFQVSAKSR